MWLHDLRLALRSLRRNPFLTALTIGALAAGIGATVITVTLYHARAGHPIWWKENRLFAVTLDMRAADPDMERFARHPEYPPFQLTYRDAQELYRSKIPAHSVMMFRAVRVVDPGPAGMKPFSVSARVTTADFFTMFDVPFLQGAGWTRAADAAPEPVVVIGRHLNEKLFHGADSVGRMVLLSGKQFRVIGVVDTWLPQPKFYDLSVGSFDIPEEAYVPFGWTTALQIPTAGGTSCYTKEAKVGSFSDLLTADCVWLEYWVEMGSVEQQHRFQQFADNYVTDQRRYGRFPRPLNNRIVNVTAWLAMNDVVGDETRLDVALAAMFLIVSVLNTLGLMLAKFLGSAAVTGLRRALGASRRDIIRQHLVEVVVVGLLGGTVGVMLSWLGLWAIRLLTYTPGVDDSPDRLAMAQSLSHMDYKVLLLAAVISLLSGVIAGLYPAWRIGRMHPALFLKTQ
jgi:putative ABC transport system permease protein